MPMRVKRLRIGLTIKFGMLTMLPIVYVLFVLIYFIMESNLHQIKPAVMERGESIIRAISIGSEYGLLIENKDLLNDVIMRYKDEKDLIYVIIRNLSGDIVATYGDVQKLDSEKDKVIMSSSSNHEVKQENILFESESNLNLNFQLTETDKLFDITCDVATVSKAKSRESIGFLEPDSMTEKMQKIGTIQLGLSKAGMIENIRKTRLRAIWMTGLFFVVAILITFLTVRKMLKPIRQLAMATTMVSYGDFSQSVEFRPKDEIGDLTESFSKMLVDLRRARDKNEEYKKELEQKTEQLTQSNEELNVFVYTVSHDLKAPLLSMQGFSALLLSSQKDRVDDTGKMYVERIQKNSEKMAAMIDDLLELSRVGRIKVQEEQVQVSEIISELVNEFSPQFEKKGTRFIINDGMPTVRCDRTRLTQVFTNLISNANKFMGDDNKNPTIEVGYNNQGDYYEFYVKDNGIGIDREYYERIFHIFQRLNDVQTEGTGVGLAIVKKIVENFGGRIRVDSAKNAGTTMYFTLPKD